MQHRQIGAVLLIAARGLNKAQFICCVSHFVTRFAPCPHISFAKQVVGRSISFVFPHLSDCVKLFCVMMVFFFSPFRILPFFAFKLEIKSVNQRQWHKDMETEGHLNPFRVPKASEGKMNRNLKRSRQCQQSVFCMTESRCTYICLLLHSLMCWG